MFGIFKKQNRQITTEEARKKYPFTGNCPVVLRTADGVGMGRCYHSLYGNICPSHGDLTGKLVKIEEPLSAEQFERIEEDALPPREQRQFVPEEYLKALHS